MWERERDAKMPASRPHDKPCRESGGKTLDIAVAPGECPDETIDGLPGHRMSPLRRHIIEWQQDEEPFGGTWMWQQGRPVGSLEAPVVDEVEIHRAGFPAQATLAAEPFLDVVEEFEQGFRIALRGKFCDSVDIPGLIAVIHGPRFVPGRYTENVHTGTADPCQRLLESTPRRPDRRSEIGAECHIYAALEAGGDCRHLRMLHIE